ncbi:hypothetical protein C8R47DRAFT_572219 [Mycena vitilis]|nr:hypothetical protein C8R47DRAFT_572219 [Mycena vitilis]
MQFPALALHIFSTVSCFQFPRSPTSLPLTPYPEVAVHRLMHRTELYSNSGGLDRKSPCTLDDTVRPGGQRTNASDVCPPPGGTHSIMRFSAQTMRKSAFGTRGGNVGTEGYGRRVDTR